VSSAPGTRDARAVARALSERVPTRVNVYAEMARIAAEVGAVSVSQGAPDMPAPDAMVEAAVAALRSGHNQYSPSEGIPALREEVAAAAALPYGADDVTISAGCTEALLAALVSVLPDGGEVLAFEPYYDAYPPLVTMAGGRLVAVPLARTDRGYTPDVEALRRAVSPCSRVLLLNSPHNPTGMVLDDAQLAAVADLAVRHDLVVVTDEVYERLVYDGVHRSIATLPGMAERTIVCSAVTKTFSATGWRVGWALATGELRDAIRAVHRFVTFCAPTPLQHAAAAALAWSRESAYLDAQRDEYRTRRDLLLAGLDDAGFALAPPASGWFVVAKLPGELAAMPSRAAAERLARDGGVAGLPLEPFCAQAAAVTGLVRLAFCKDGATVEEANRRLRGYGAATSGATAGTSLVDAGPQQAAR
jgi:N-succinyldiaminopimelate aminotransferase